MNPGESPQETAQNYDVSRWMNDIPRFGLIILGCLYSVGLLIINIDLGRYGLISLNLARPEYIMAGVLWAFLSLGTLGAIQLLSEAIRAVSSSIKAKSTKSVFGVFWIAFFIFGTMGILDTMLTTLSRRTIGLLTVVNFASFFTSSAIALNAWMLYATFQSFKNFGKERQPLSPKTMFYATYRGFSPFWALVLFLGALSAYSFLAYPLFAKEFGGGHKPVVKLLVSPSPAFSPSKLDLPVVGNNESIGPVTLVFESDTMFFVKPIDPDEKIWGPWASRTTTTVGIAKGLVQALTYIPKETKK